MPVRFDGERLDHIALLSRLHLSVGEREALQRHLNKMLDYVDKLALLDTERVYPSPSAFELRNVFREDDPAPSLPREAALGNAPEQADGGFKVPQVLE